MLLLSLIAILTVMFLFAAGWKLNPVVGAVYSPEFYAGKGCSMIVQLPMFDFSIL